MTCPCQRSGSRPCGPCAGPGLGALSEWKATDLLCPSCKLFRDLTAEGAPTDPLAIAERAVDGWGAYVPLVLGALGGAAALALVVVLARRLKEAT